MFLMHLVTELKNIFKKILLILIISLLVACGVIRNRQR